MKRYLPTTLALTFVFVFVFSLAATVTADISAQRPLSKCGSCCTIPATSSCTALYGRYVFALNKCSCFGETICYDEWMKKAVCVYRCPVCF